jgi:hypothetical protein
MGRVRGANPDALTVTTYAPGKSSGTRKTPSAEVNTDREACVASFMASTSAWPIMRLETSVTTPEMAPVPGACARAMQNWRKDEQTQGRKMSPKYCIVHAISLEVSSS